MRAFIILLLAAMVLSMEGCYYDNEEDLYPGTFCDTADVNYSGEIDAIVQGKCAIPGCHVAGGDGNGDFTVFSELSDFATDGTLLRSVRREAGALGMPPSGPLRDCEIRQIELWVASGNPNN